MKGEEKEPWLNPHNLKSLGLLTYSGGMSRQLVITCLVFTSSTKPRGHSPAHTSSKGFEPGPVLWCLKHFISWTSAACHLLKHAEGIYILSLVYILFFKILFEWVLIGRNNHAIGEASTCRFLVRKYLCY